MLFIFWKKIKGMWTSKLLIMINEIKCYALKIKRCILGLWLSVFVIPLVVKQLLMSMKTRTIDISVVNICKC
jgi:hypothetical protein